MKKIKVAVLANLKVNAPKFEGMSEDQWDDLDSEKTISVMVEAIRSAGHECEFLEGDRTLMDHLEKFKPDILINIPYDAAGTLDFDKAEELIKLGEMAAKEAISYYNRQDC